MSVTFTNLQLQLLTYADSGHQLDSHRVQVQYRNVLKWTFLVIAVILVLAISLRILKPEVNSSIIPAYCQTLHMKSKTPISRFNKLYHAVANVGDWEGLCLNLDVDEAKMDHLKHSNFVGPESKKRDCLKAYWNTGEAIWETVIQAVAAYPITNVELAKKIANSHNISYTCGTSDGL